MTILVNSPARITPASAKPSTTLATFAGIRTSKNVNGTVHTYTLNGTQVVSETWGQRMLV